MGTAGVLSFGTMNTAQNRFFWRGAYSAGTVYNPYDVVSYLGAAYIALTTQSGVLPTNTGSWDQMTSAGAVSSVAGRVGNVVLSSSDLSDKDAVNGVAGLDANAFLKASEFNLTINAQTGTTYTFVAADRAKLVTFNNAGAVAAGLPQATGSFATGWYCEVENIGAGLVTITPTTSTIEGATSITLNQYESVTLVSSGGNYLCLRSKVRVTPTTATAHQFVTAIAGDGTATKAQPAFSDISGTIGTGQITATVATAHQFLTAIASDGTATKAQPAFSDISGTVAASQLPAPTATTLGGIESFAAQSSKWINAISTAGVPSATQPASTDLSDVATLATLTGTQTLKNKTLNGAASGNSITLLSFQSNTSTLTGNSADQTVYTFTIPANTIAAGKGIRVTFFGQHFGGASAQVWKMWFGATAITSLTDNATTGAVNITGYIFNNPGSQTAQNQYVQAIWPGSGTVSGNGTLPAENTNTNSVVVKVTFNGPNTTTALGNLFLIELIQ